MEVEDRLYNLSFTIFLFKHISKHVSHGHRLFHKLFKTKALPTVAQRSHDMWTRNMWRQKFPRQKLTGMTVWQPDCLTPEYGKMVEDKETCGWMGGNDNALVLLTNLRIQFKHKHRWNETDLRVKKRSFWKEKMETGHGGGQEKRDSETNDAIYISTSISVFISTIPQEVNEQ